MLARRFTIVCLLTTLFGMLFAILVTEVSRPARSGNIGLGVPCVFDNDFTCAPPSRQ